MSTGLQVVASGHCHRCIRSVEIRVDPDSFLSLSITRGHLKSCFLCFHLVRIYVIRATRSRAYIRRSAAVPSPHPCLSIHCFVASTLRLCLRCTRACVCPSHTRTRAHLRRACASITAPTPRPCLPLPLCRHTCSAYVSTAPVPCPHRATLAPVLPPPCTSAAAYLAVPSLRQRLSIHCLAASR